MKEARENITIAALIAAVVVVPAAIISGIALLISRNDTMSTIVFVGIFVADLLGLYRWSRRRVTVHTFLSHAKMHPELLPKGRTEFDLECFRKQWSKGSRMTLDEWARQFSRKAPATRPSSQFR